MRAEFSISARAPGPAACAFGQDRAWRRPRAGPVSTSTMA